MRITIQHQTGKGHLELRVAAAHTILISILVIREAETEKKTLAQKKREKRAIFPQRAAEWQKDERFMIYAHDG